MNGLTRTMGSILMVVSAVSSQPAHAFGLGEFTKPMGKTVEAAFIKVRARTAAPFSHVVFCSRMPSECVANSSQSSVSFSGEKRRQLNAVNRRVNRQIIARNDDSSVLGGDDWSLAPRAGDCEDFAITKRHSLIQMGWPSGALRLAVAHTAWGEGHLVLVVRTDQGDLVLDNLTNSVRKWNRTGLRWEMIQSAENPRNWNRI